VDVDIEVRPGSVHALVGHNGCGKSTLIKCLAGVYEPDPGSHAWINGEPLQIGDPGDAERKGLRFVHQDLGIISELSAVDNVGFILGYERSRWGGISWRRQTRRTEELLERFGFSFDPNRPLGDASPPERSAVAIVRAIAGWQAGRGVLVLDEPTAALPAHEVDRLFRLIREVSETGTAVILVSHRLDEVTAIADHVTVLRAGQQVWDGPLASTSLSHLVDLIAHREGPQANVERRDRRRPAAMTGRLPALKVSNIQGRLLRGVSLTVGEGELVGIAGLLGSGREELPYVVAGALTEGITGQFEVGGVQVDKLSVGRARAMGIVLVPADRADEAVFPDFNTRENVSLAGLPGLGRLGLFTPRSERLFARRWLNAVHAHPKYEPMPISTLSGGNQQKAVLARSLSVAPRVLVLSEPTAGVDIGARQVIYRELRRRAEDGLAVLMASSDIEDLLACCDRVIALRDGVVTGEFTGSEMTKTSIAYAMEGVHDDQP
jgi:ribose transport system ATP-binding protein